MKPSERTKQGAPVRPFGIVVDCGFRDRWPDYPRGIPVSFRKADPDIQAGNIAVSIVPTAGELGNEVALDGKSAQLAVIINGVM